MSTRNQATIFILGSWLTVLFPLLAAAQNTVDEASRLNQQCMELYQQGRCREAIPLAQRVLQLRERQLGPSHLDVGRIQNDLGLLYQASGQYKDAECAFLRAKEIVESREGQDGADYASCLNNLGMLYSKMGDYDKALAILSDAQQIDKRSHKDTTPPHAALLSNLALVYQGMADYPQAETLLEQALQIYRNVSGENNPSYSMILIYLANNACLAGDYGKTESEQWAVEARHRSRQVLGENHPVYASSLNTLAALRQEKGDYIKAELLFRQVVQIDKQVLGESHSEYATALNNLGLVCRYTGKYEMAEQYLRQAADIHNTAFGCKHPSYLMDLNNLADLYQLIGHYRKAKSLLEHVIEIRKETLGATHPDYATSLSNLATLHCETGNYADAKVLQEQALAIHKKALGVEHWLYANDLNNLGLVCQNMSDYERAETLFREASEIQKKIFGEDHPTCATTLNNIAMLYLEKGDYSHCEPCLLKTSEMLRKLFGVHHLAYAWSLYNLSILYEATSRHKKALETFIEALEVRNYDLKNVFRFTAEPAMRDYQAKIYEDLCGLISMVSMSGIPDEQDKAMTWVLRMKATIMDAICRFHETEALLQSDEKISSRAGELRGLRQRISKALLNPELSTRQHEPQLQVLMEKAERLETDLRRSIASTNFPQRTDDRIDTVTVGSGLSNNSALVEIIRAGTYDFKATGVSRRWKPPRYVAFVLTANKSKPIRMIDLGDAQELEGKLQALRDTIEQAGRDLRATSSERARIAERSCENGFREVSAELYRRVFAPLCPELQSVNTLYISPDGELNRLPFEALVDEKGKYLTETYRIVYLSSGRDLLHFRRPTGKGTVVLADPDFDMDSSHRQVEAMSLLAQLPTKAEATFRGIVPGESRGLKWDRLLGTELEAKNVQQVLGKSKLGPVRCYRGAQALEEVLKSIQAPRILHLATHGFFISRPKQMTPDTNTPMSTDLGFGAAVGLARLRAIDNPMMRSGIVLAGANTIAKDSLSATPASEDGWVTAEEISQLNLHGTDLVVLSACETGLGDIQSGEGVYGLRRAFIYAGAQSVITSLFKVPDKQTQELMGAFYKSLKAGRNKLDALHDAQLSIIHQRRAKTGAAHPYFWANFILVGNPN